MAKRFKIKPYDVIQIRKAFALLVEVPGERSGLTSRLARNYNVAHSTISRIRRGETYPVKT